MKIGKEFENAMIVYTENPKESTKLQKVVKYILGRSQDPSLTQKLSNYSVIFHFYTLGWL